MSDEEKPKLEVITGGDETDAESEVVKRAFRVVTGSRLPNIEPTKPVEKLKFNLIKVEDSPFYTDREIYTLCQALVMTELVTRDSSVPIATYTKELTDLTREKPKEAGVNAGVVVFDSLVVLESLFKMLGTGHMGRAEVDEFLHREYGETEDRVSGLWYDQALLTRMIEAINITKQLAIDAADQRGITTSELMMSIRESVARDMVGTTSQQLEDLDATHELHSKAWGEVAAINRAKRSKISTEL